MQDSKASRNPGRNSGCYEVLGTKIPQRLEALKGADRALLEAPSLAIT